MTFTAQMIGSKMFPEPSASSLTPGASCTSRTTVFEINENANGKKSAGILELLEILRIAHLLHVGLTGTKDSI